MNKRNLLIALLLVGFFAAGGWSAMHYYQSSVTQAEEGTPPDNTYYPPKNEEVLSAEAEMDRIIQEESEHGCLEEKHGVKVWCGESKKRVEAAHEKAIAAAVKLQMPSQEILEQRFATMRALQDNAVSNFTFDGTSGNPYVSGNQRRTEIYHDERDTVYMVDTETGMVIQYGPNGPKSDWHKFTPALTKEQLRAKAIQYLSTHIKDFEVVQKEFTYTESGKALDDPNGRATFAFRWEGKRIQGEDMPPFVQVVMTAGGDIPTFTDTRALYNYLNQ